MNKAEKIHRERVAAIGCVVCRRHLDRYVPCEIHHVAEGSGLRSHFSIAGLCPEHHQGKTGLHGLSARTFVRTYRVPGESEYGLLVWVNEDLARSLNNDLSY